MKKILLALLFLGAGFVGRSQTDLNTPPNATTQTVSTNEDTQLNSIVTGTDAENDPLTFVQGATSVQHGSLTLNPDGTFTYTPDLNYNGSDAFGFKAYDGKDYSSEATVTITVNAVNDAPVAANATVSGPEDGGAITGSVIASDVDNTAAQLTYSVVNGVAASQGVLSFNADGTYSFTPAANFNGTITFTYKANDGTVDSDPATVTLTVTPVNDAPVAVDNTASTNEDITLTQSTSVLANDNDIDDANSALTAVLVTNVPSAQGNVTLNSNGTYTFVPAANFNGTTNFTYKAKDAAGAESNVATVTITVNAVNDAPTAFQDGPVTTPEDVPLTIDVLANDKDPENDAMSIVLGTTTNGTVAVSNGKVVFTPALDYNGTATFIYQAKDANDALSNPITVTVSVTPVLDAADRLVVLNEIYTDPDTSKKKGNSEFFELYNTSPTQTINLDCYTLITYWDNGTDKGFYVLDLPAISIAPLGYAVGAAANPFKVQDNTGTYKADFNWNDFSGTTGGSLKKYTLNAAGTGYIISNVNATNGGNDLFYNFNKGGAKYATFLFNNGFYVNGFLGNSTVATVPAPLITGKPAMNVGTSCGGFTVDWTSVNTAEFYGPAIGNDNGFVRVGDGICGQWTKQASGNTFTPGTTNPSGAYDPTDGSGGVVSSQALICGNKIDLRISSIVDASAFPITVQLYYDYGTIGKLDASDVLQTPYYTITADQVPYSTTISISANQPVLLVYRTALGCINQIIAPTSIPNFTTAQYNYCNQLFGAAITAADAVTLANAFPVTVNFYNTVNGTKTLIGSQTINSPSTTPVYSNFSTTPYTAANISIEYVPKGSSCLQTTIVSNASSTSFKQASGGLNTNELFVLTNPNTAGSPGKMQVRVTGLINPVLFDASNILPITARLYWDHNPGSADDVFIEEMTIDAFSATYKEFQKVFTKADMDANGGSLVVTYTAAQDFKCLLNTRKEGISLAVLPVHFVSFTAVRKDDTKVALTWTTATEQNNRGFHVQRNTGSGWQDIAFVFSAAENGTSTSELNYSFTDVNPSKGVSQYRILQVDLDGKGRYSEIRSVKGNTSGKLLLFPNPSSTGSVTLLFDTEGAKDVLVSDASGRLVQQFKKVMGNSLVIRNLNNGFYTVRVQEVSTGVSTTEKFIITKR